MSRLSFRYTRIVFLALWFGLAAPVLATSFDRAKHAVDLRGKRVVVVALLGHTAVAFKHNGFFSNDTNERVDPGFTLDTPVRETVVAQLQSFGVEAEGVTLQYDDAAAFQGLRPAFFSSGLGHIRDDYLRALAARLMTEHRPDAVLVVSRSAISRGQNGPYYTGYGVLADDENGIPFAAMVAHLFVPDREKPLFDRAANMTKLAGAVASQHEQNLPTAQMWSDARPVIEECATRSARVLGTNVYARALAGGPLTFEERRRYPRDELVLTETR